MKRKLKELGDSELLNMYRVCVRISEGAVGLYEPPFKMSSLGKEILNRMKVKTVAFDIETYHGPRFPGEYSSTTIRH